MFDISWSEMAIILLVALVVIGPKDLPRLARTLGQWVAKGRSMAREFQRSLEDMAREAELDDVKREIEKIGRTDIGKSIEKTIDPTGEIGKAFEPTAASKTRGAKAADSEPPVSTTAPASSAAPASSGAPASPAANGGATPEPAEVAFESKPAAPEPKAPKAKTSKARTPKAETPKAETPKAEAKAKPEAVSAEPR